MFIIEQKYGNDGYAFWFKLLEMIGTADGHTLSLKDDMDWEFLTAKTNLDKEKCTEIMELLATLGAVDKDLWVSDKVIWIENFVDNIKDAYRNRVVETPVRPDTLRKKPQGNEDKLRKKPTDETILDEMKEDDINKESPEYRLSELLLNKIKENNPNYKEPNLNTWVIHMEKMIRIDKRNPNEIKKVIDWCQADSFWYKNILSTEKLRKQYDQLTVNMEDIVDSDGENSAAAKSAKKCYTGCYGNCGVDRSNPDKESCVWCFSNLK